ncbi:MAG: gamma carbonic anhydrase family protein, partial [Candidatus Bathyarchaeia archaeon]
GDNLIPFKGKAPRPHESSYVDPAARVIGDVEISEGASVWPGAVIRGDDSQILIGRMAVVLENCIVEAPSGLPVRVGERALISHGAILHGCLIGDGALVGIGAIVLDGAKVGDRAIVAAGALVPPNGIVEDGKLAMGIPAKPVRDVTATEMEAISKEVERLHWKAMEYKRILERPRPTNSPHHALT